MLAGKLGKNEFEIIIPSKSTFAKTTIAVVDKVIDNRGTRDVATSYLKYLYTLEAQIFPEKLLPPT